MSGDPTSVLLVADTLDTADRVAVDLSRAADRIDVPIAVTTATDPAASERFDCLVTAARSPETVSELTDRYPSTPLVALVPDSLSARETAALPADALVQRDGETSGLVLARRIESLTEVPPGNRRIGGVADQVDAAVLTVDEAWTVTFCNDGVADVLDRDPAAVTGRSVWELLDATVGSTVYNELQSAASDGEVRTFRTQGEALDRWLEIAVYPDDEGVVLVVSDVTDEERRERTLAGVLETTRELMQGRTRREVGELVASAAENTLDFDYAVVRLYDPEREVLEPVGWTAMVESDLDDPPAYDLDEVGPGEVFATGEPRWDEGAADFDDGYGREVIDSAIHIPIGVHGTLSIGATEPDGFDTVERNLAEILATNAAVAFSRAKREQEARAARDRVETLLDRIDGLVTDTLEVLVSSTTREEIEEGVCGALTAADPYRFAWIGAADLAGERLSASAWGGTADLDVGDYDRSLDGDEALDASALALRDHDLRVVTDLTATERDWERRAADADLRSLCAVPLTYQDTTYGVLSVYAEQADAFDEREQAVLGALGKTVAGAIDAIERGRILSTNRVIEMELSSRDPDLLFSRLSSALGCRIESTGPLTRSGDTLDLYVLASTTDHEAVLAAARDDDAVASITHVVTQDGATLFEMSVTDSVVGFLAGRGAVTERIAGEDGTTTLTAELPQEAEAREVYDLLADRYDDLDLVGYHEHDRPVRTREEFRAALRDRFTDRQETALRSAYLGGFFEWPRDVDGDDLAEAMDITRPTYHQHLRTAERKVFEELFD